MTLHVRHVCRHVEVTDAPTRRDPTGTSRLRARLRAEADRRWQVLARTLRQALIEHDLVGLRGIGRLAHGDKTAGFAAWLHEELRQKVLGGDGSWLKPYVQQAVEIAGARAAEAAPGGQIDPARTIAMETLAASELRGICEAAQQQLVRSVTQSMMANASPTRTANAAADVIKTMRLRTGTMGDWIIAKTHATTTLSAFRSAGTTQVGTVPEYVRRVPPPAIGKLMDRRRRDEEDDDDEVNVLTAGDDLVCDECQDISDGGPYDLDEAEGLIPAHPRCRCAFVPVRDRRFASVHETDAFDPSQLRDPHGKWTAGGGSVASPSAGMSHDDVRAAARKVADDLGFDASRIDVVAGTRQFDVNGVMHVAAGDADITKGDENRIRLYAEHVNPNTVAAVMAHEIEHEKYQGAMDAYRRDSDAMMKDPGPPPDPNHSYYWGKRGGSDAIMTPTGALREPYDKKYPNYTDMHEAFFAPRFEDFSKGDGVSDYSAEYWKGYHDGKVSPHIAMHETLAEMARIKYTTGKFPDHYGYSRLISERIKAAPGKPDYVEKASGQAAGTKQWRDLYRTVDRIHKRRTK